MELKPCPACKLQKIVLHRSDHGYYVQCDTCGLRTDYCSTGEEAWTAWSRRADEKPAPCANCHVGDGSFVRVRIKGNDFYCEDCGRKIEEKPAPVAPDFETRLAALEKKMDAVKPELPDAESLKAKLADIHEKAKIVQEIIRIDGIEGLHENENKLDTLFAAIFGESKDEKAGEEE